MNPPKKIKSTEKYTQVTLSMAEDMYNWILVQAEQETQGNKAEFMRKLIQQAMEAEKDD
jgi:hypothetical protein